MGYEGGAAVAAAATTTAVGTAVGRRRRRRPRWSFRRRDGKANGPCLRPRIFFLDKGVPRLPSRAHIRKRCPLHADMMSQFPCEEHFV